MAEKTLLVGNPTAQSGRNESRIQNVLDRLAARGVTTDFLATQPKGRTVETLRIRLDETSYTCVVYMGGDGTFAEVAKGILAAGEAVPMGMLPSGTANDQGKSFGISSNPDTLERNLDVIANRHLTYLDVGRIHRYDDSGEPTDSDLFFDSAGFGMAPDILSVRNRDRERVGKIPLLRELYRDKLVYVGAALNRYLASWLEPTKFAAEIDCDGVIHHYDGLTDLIVKGTPVYAGSWILDRDSEPDDGIFEVIPIRGRREWFSKAIRDLAVFPLTQDDLDQVGITHSQGLSGHTFEIRLERPGRELVPSQIDGESWEPGKVFQIEVFHGRLPLITPKSWCPPWKH